MNLIFRAALSLAAGMLILLLVPELAAPVSAGCAKTVWREPFAYPLDSSDGLIDAQITRRHGTIHSRPATNPTTPPAPRALSVAPTCPSGGLRASGSTPGAEVRG